MKKIIIIVVCLSMFTGNLLPGQNAVFFTTGVIEYEKTVNMYALIKKGINGNNEVLLQDAFEKYKQSNPQFKVLKSTLSFVNNKTLFTPDPASPASGFFNDLPMVLQNNIVYTDLGNDSQVSQKKVYSEIFLLKDSTRKIRWKITDETRVIAGYNCRRANAIILDSIYVVAFYSSEIPVSGGPESFAGLPGMILQVTLPHENITWLAKRVRGMDISETSVAPPQNGKVVDRKNLSGILETASKSWGDNRESALKSFFL